MFMCFSSSAQDAHWIEVAYPVVWHAVLECPGRAIGRIRGLLEEADMGRTRNTGVDSVSEAATEVCRVLKASVRLAVRGWVSWHVYPRDLGAYIGWQVADQVAQDQRSLRIASDHDLPLWAAVIRGDERCLHRRPPF